MRLLSLLALLLLTASSALAAPGAGKVPYPGGVLSWQVRSGHTVLTVTRPHEPPAKLRLRRDDTVPAGGTPIGMEVIGTMGDSLIIVADQYASKPAGLSRCRAGTERFLRVLVLAGKSGIERFRSKLDSCLDNIELATPGLEWNVDDHSLQVHWLSSPGQAGVAKDSLFRVSPESVTEQPGVPKAP